MKDKKFSLRVVAVLVLVGFLGVAFVIAIGGSILSRKVDENFNRISGTKKSTSARALALHKKLTIVDLHADSLLWNRDLLVRNDRGHVDVPRLIEGNVAVQVFTIVTKVPEGMNIKSNTADSDKITALAIGQGWPPATYNSLVGRTLYQADKLQRVADASSGKLTVIRSVQDLDKYLERRKQDSKVTAGILGIEGAHAMEGKVANLDVFYDHGIRLIGLSHFFDNEMAGSAHGVKKYGLTDDGKKLVVLMQQKSMIVDLAHASHAVIKDVLAIAEKPVVVSHTGVKGTCNNERNLTDSEILGVAKTGGVVGIGYWKTATCGCDVGSIVKAISYVVKLAGIDHVALGSDYDGAVTVPFDTARVSLITDELLKQGFSNADIEKIMGGNALRVLRHSLPEK
ncbi:MAG: dipeptidase [Candidatus Obscuribacterales bacterium]|nr:dipeptidase [Cyanobacteria bacterium HKST-UBA01]MCB9470933.1 dipeptidase [Candidatus Obscuribacterales bacterium]